MISPLKKLIFPTDFSDVSIGALPMAKFFAQKLSAELVFLHVIEPPTGVAKVFSDFNEDLALAEARKMLQAFVQKHETPADAELPFSMLVKIGKPYQKIIEAIDEIGAVLAVLGTAGSSGLHASLVGSNSGKVIRMTSCPVVSLKNALASPEISNILLPMGAEGANNPKVAGAIRFAKLLGATLEVVAFVVKEDEAKAKHAVQEVKDHAAAQGIETSRNEVVVLTEPPTAAVLQFAQYAKSDMVCVLTENDPSLSTALLESASEYIVHRAEIPVLSISNPTKFSLGGQAYFG